MGTITLDLLHAIHPIACTRDVLEKDTQELEAAGFLKQVKDAPGQWTFAQVGGLPCPGLHNSVWSARQHSTQAQGHLQQHAAPVDKTRQGMALPAPTTSLCQRPGTL